jgi:hypothetical protein
MKTCTKCGCTKPLSDFHAHPNGSQGRKSICKVCCNSHAISYRKRTAEHHQAYRASNRQRMKAYNAEMYVARRDAEKQRCAEYFQQNKAARASYVAKRKAAKINATPAWADSALIKMLYTTRQYMTEQTGFEWHVDHVVPLQGRNVCGLHVHNNLRVVPRQFNLQKGNNYDPDKTV